MKVYLIHLYYYNDIPYEPMYSNEVIAVFDTEDKAKQFCIDNSDNDEYEILKPRNLMVGDKCVYEFDDDEIGELEDYDLGIEEMEVN